MPDQQTGELTAQEAKACAHRAQGKSKSDAYRLAFTKRRCTEKSLNEQASHLFAKPQIQSRVTELLSQARVQDLLSIGEWGEMVLDGARDTREAKNWPAFANLTRQLGQAVGALQETVSMTIEGRTDDLVLLEKLAGSDPAKLAALQAVLGAKDTFDA